MDADSDNFFVFVNRRVSACICGQEQLPAGDFLVGEGCEFGAAGFQADGDVAEGGALEQQARGLAVVGAAQVF